MFTLLSVPESSSHLYTLIHQDSFKYYTFMQAYIFQAAYLLKILYAFQFKPPLFNHSFDPW